MSTDTLETEQPAPPVEEAKVEQDGTAVEEVVVGEEDAKDFEFPNKMDIRIVSDGKRTSVFDAEGKALGLVQSIQWTVDARTQLPKCKITMIKVPVNLVVRDTKVKYKSAYKRLRSKNAVAPPIPSKGQEDAADSAPAAN